MKRLTALIFVLLSLCIVTVPVSLLAHELLPKDVQEFISRNPEATPEDIERYIRQNAPVLSKMIKNRDDIVRILDRKTSLLDTLFDFVTLGIHHILSGPDHLLFVLSLLLAVVSLKEIVKLTGTFTIAHSVTLILAGSGIVTLPSALVEPVIAFSIAFVAITGVFFHSKKNAAAIFFFGLFHGLGFAGLLKEIQLPDDTFIPALFAFNLGIEIGQLLIVAAVVPLMYLIRRTAWHDTVIKILAAIIAAIGIVWGIQRILT